MHNNYIEKIKFSNDGSVFAVLAKNGDLFFLKYD